MGREHNFFELRFLLVTHGHRFHFNFTGVSQVVGSRPDVFSCELNFIFGVSNVVSYILFFLYLCCIFFSFFISPLTILKGPVHFLLTLMTSFSLSLSLSSLFFFLFFFIF